MDLFENSVRSTSALESTVSARRFYWGESVKPGNATDLLQQPNVDGALVGGASLTAELFVPIVEAAVGLKSPYV